MESTTIYQNSIKKAVLYGVLSSIFFSVTFILNRSMNLGGGSYLWSSSLRYIFMLPLLWILIKKKDRQQVYTSIKSSSKEWFIWSIIGFGLFYLPLSYASNYAPSWLVAGLWQVTIVSGILLTPLFGKKIPIKNLLFSLLILGGAFLLQIENSSQIDLSENIFFIFSVLLASVCYPLGNRNMMKLCGNNLNTIQRIFGMTLCSLPFWLLISGKAFLDSGIPSLGQMGQSFLVALFSGVIATILFFKATDEVKHNHKHLAIVEATQAGEVIFTLLGGVLFLGDSLPTTLGFIGMGVILLGMTLNSLEN